ncbi:hypothetical protein ACH0CP_02145 [Sphingomonas sp. 179-I 2A4 NHS]|uniref:hypothetical protein n=2 Tax=Sphingomonas TaxID=13687 RepID=UPI00387A2BF1
MRDVPLTDDDEMKSVASHNQAMQRVKVGLVGLALVVLLIGLASAIFSAANREKPVAAPGAPQTGALTNLTVTNTSDAANEPLAELGVAPSATDPSPSPAPEANRQ